MVPKFIRNLVSLFNPKADTTITKFMVINSNSSTPGVVPDADHMWYDEAIAVNRADNIIYRRVGGIMYRYTVDPTFKVVFENDKATIQA